MNESSADKPKTPEVEGGQTVAEPNTLSKAGWLPPPKDARYFPPQPDALGNKQLCDEELEAIKLRREKAWQRPTEPPSAEPLKTEAAAHSAFTCSLSESPAAHSWDLVGLAISGGGIRSATFALGVLQGLAYMKLLRCVDYLSTVSGGGFIGSWLIAWIKRSKSMDDVVNDLNPDLKDHDPRSEEKPTPKTKPPCQEPPEIQHLRQFSNYLTPRKSLFSADTWTLVAIYLRNLLANQLCLLPALLGVVLLVRIIATLFAAQPHIPFDWMKSLLSQPMVTLAVAFILRWLWVIPLLAISCAFLLVNFSLGEVRKLRTEKGQAKTGWLTSRQMCFLIMVMLCIAAPLVIWLTTPWHDASGQFRSRLPHWNTLTGRSLESLTAYCYLDLLHFTILFAILHLAPVAVRIYQFSGTQPLDLRFIDRLRYVTAAAASGALGGALLYALLNCWLWKHADDAALIVTFGPSCLLAIVGACANMEVILVGRSAQEDEREWWARMSAWCMILALGWLAIFGLCLFGGLWVFQLSDWAKANVTLGWVATAIGGVMAGNSGSTNGKSGSFFKESAAILAPYVFLLGLLCHLSLGAHYIAALNSTGLEGSSRSVADKTTLNADDNLSQNDGVRVILETDGTLTPEWKVEPMAEKRSNNDKTYYNVISKPGAWLLMAFGVCFFSFLFSLLVDINEFSLNAADANRLTRCYLGASRNDPSRSAPTTKRNPDGLTGFDLDDDMPLSDLKIGEKYGYYGPLPIINTTLNLVSGDNLAWQERMAESFILTPYRFGSHELGYRENAFDEKQRNGMLGRAVAISGAAANPNMGYHSSPAVTALLTLFNVRVGWWLPNPKPYAVKADPHDCSKHERWPDVKRRPKFLLKWLLAELFGFTNANSDFVNLSDGGHFENLGVYELVRRRCRLIILSDGEADPEMTFHAMGNVIRRCRSDFGIDIEINVDPMRRDPVTGLSHQHCVVGTIRYDQVDQGAPVGTILYIKATLTGDESTDIQQYKSSHSEFPHEPTADQFFGESQFESYRKLGLHCVEKALGGVANNLTNELSKASTQADAVSNLVYLLRREWFPATPQTRENFLAAVEPYVRFHEELRDQSAAAAVTTGMYPELKFPEAAAAAAANRSEVVNEKVEALVQAFETQSARSSPNRFEFHLVVQMIQVLENAWLAADLSLQHAHPLNVGWMNLFRRWSMVPALRRYWPVLRHEFSREFVKFCENWAMFSPGERTLHPVRELDNMKQEREQLLAEYEAEWRFDLKPEMSTMSLEYWLSKDKPVEDCWFVQVRSTGESPVTFVAGMVGLRPIGKGYYEFMIWVRPQFREHGIGQWMLEDEKDRPVWGRLEQVRKERNTIILRYPNESWIGKGRQVAKARWLSYFDFYEFHRPSSTEQRGQIETNTTFDSVHLESEHWKSFEVLVFRPEATT